MAKPIMGSREAAKVAGVSHATICEWCRVYGIGELEAGVYRVDRAALRRIMRAREVLKAPDAAI